VVPHGFRTNLYSAGTKEEEVAGGRRHRSIQAEADKLVFPAGVPFGDSAGWRLVHLPSNAVTYRINRGPRTSEQELDPTPSGAEAAARGFWIETGVDTSVFGDPGVPEQAISMDARLRRRTSKFKPTGPSERVWLGAPKSTQALYLTAHGLKDGLAMDRLPSVAVERALDETPDEENRRQRWIGVRAAAISASFLLANRASQDLDVADSEFDVLEPRRYGESDQRPLLTLTDQLVNGAGYCSWLAELEDGTPRIGKIIGSVLTDDSAYPRRIFMEKDHAETCHTSCYRCLRRYGNQPYHGLLDWRLGLAFLRALVDPAYDAGLTAAGTVGPDWSAWKVRAEHLAMRMAERFGVGEQSDNFMVFGSGVPGFRIAVGRGKSSPWTLVRHPLWAWDENGPAEVVDSRLAEAYEEARGLTRTADCWDSFNLERRQVFVRERIRMRHGST